MNNMYSILYTYADSTVYDDIWCMYTYSIYTAGHHAAYGLHTLEE